jgi:hypothetical protein
MKGMKKTVFFAVILAALVMASCTTTDVSTNRVGWSDYVDLAAKDFQSLGVVALKTQEVVSVSPLHMVSDHTGSRVTYAALFDEASKLGADDITNVRIDMQVEQKTTPFDWLIGSKTTYTYTGTALAIKYTAPIDRVKSSNQKEINAQ